MQLHVSRHFQMFGFAILMGAALPIVAAQEPRPSEPVAEGLKKAAVPARPESSPDNRRRALELLAEAEMALEQGLTARATVLAREASGLYPESKAIAGFLVSVQAEQTLAKAATATQNRAKAHLAAALTRSQVLMQQRRYTEALDLLNGIIEAAAKFPAAADVSLYRDLAQKELIEYRVGVQTGTIRPNQDAGPPPVNDPIGLGKPEAPVSYEFPRAPSNAYRLARLSGDQTPAWYTRMRAALRRTMSVDYRAMPLGLVLDDIQESTGLPLIVDSPIQAAKTTLTTTVDLRARSVSAETVLSLATELAGCEYVLLEKGIIVTTPDKAGDYIRNLPDSVASHWSRARHLFPDLYVDAMTSRPLPEAKPATAAAGGPDQVPSYLRSGRDLVAHIEQLIR